MGNAKKSSNTLLSLLEGGMWRMGVAVALLVAVGVGLFVAWGRWGASAVQNGRQITAESIHCSPPPPWITTNVVEQALREGSLDQLSIFDRQASVRVARAFEMHPWVKRVYRVSKHPPASFQVEMTYRQPVAMVVVQTEAGTKLLPIDEEAVILPSEDFLGLPEEKIRSYPRVYVANSLPQSLPGSPWGDKRVTDAARISAAIGESWSSWGLYRLHAFEQPAEPNKASLPTYVLATRNGCEIVWGNPPGAEAAGEPPAQEKVERLAAFISQNGSLAELSADRVFDLRSPDLTPQVPRTARLREVILP